MSERSRRSKRARAWRGGLKQVRKGARNMLDILRHGRIGAPYHASYDVMRRAEHHTLRRYLPSSPDAATREREPVLLVPPLMVTSEVYDISPELSAVTFLEEHELDVWVVDFGAPERMEGGMERDLDDHILAVADSIAFIREQTGRDVHMLGYSQGGLFAYQAAAYVRSEGLASIVTFGSPVDMRRSFPIPIRDDLAGRILNVAGSALSGPLESIEGLPGALTSRGFKLLSAGKEIKQIIGFLGVLHDRDALEQREPKRKFLNGEGFVAWPGPAFRQFMDEVITHNRLARGGLVVAGRPVSLADIHCPILYFVGSRDNLARPPAVRSLRNWATSAPLYEREIQAGHFGLVVGSKAMNVVWPTVIDWIEWVHDGALDDFVPSIEDEAPPERESNIGPLYELAAELVDEVWERLGEASVDMADLIDTIRWQIPRLAQILEITPQTRISVSRLLREQADAIGERPFLLWRGRAFTYEQANEEVDRIALAMLDAGVRPGDEVGVLIHDSPSLLTVSVALNRMGAVSVLYDPSKGEERLARMLLNHASDVVIADAAGQELLDKASARAEVEFQEVLALESLEGKGSDTVEQDRDVELDAGLAKQLGMILFTDDDSALPVKITNRRWSVAALGAAAGARLTSSDTVHCPIACSSATGMLVACGGALAGGARLAISTPTSASGLLEEVRRYGASVLFYDRALLALLLSSFGGEGEGTRKLPLRAIVGMGVREEEWFALKHHLPHVDILEFFAQPEGPVCLATLTQDAPGSMGRVLPGIEGVEVVAFDLEEGAITRDSRGWARSADPDEVGLLIGRIEQDHPLFHYDGYMDDQETTARKLVGVFTSGDMYFDTGVLVRRDGAGSFWYEGRVES